MMNIWSVASDPAQDVTGVCRGRSDKFNGEDTSTPHHSLRQEDFVQISVCGMLYETLQSTLQRFPHTLLGMCSSFHAS